MKILHCPMNGPRNINEFVCFGEVDASSHDLGNSDEKWIARLWAHDTIMGRRLEWWCHTASSYWFVAERDTVTDEVIRTFPAKELFGSHNRDDTSE